MIYGIKKSEEESEEQRKEDEGKMEVINAIDVDTKGAIEVLYRTRRKRDENGRPRP